jgi:hypothetical protein
VPRSSRIRRSCQTSRWLVHPKYFPMIQDDRRYRGADAAGDAVDDRHRDGAHNRVRLGGERSRFGRRDDPHSVAVSAIGGHILAVVRVAGGQPCGDQ